MYWVSHHDGATSSGRGERGWRDADEGRCLHDLRVVVQDGAALLASNLYTQFIPVAQPHAQGTRPHGACSEGVGCLSSHSTDQQNSLAASQKTLHQSIPRTCVPQHANTQTPPPPTHTLSRKKNHDTVRTEIRETKVGAGALFWTRTKETRTQVTSPRW